MSYKVIFSYTVIFCIATQVRSLPLGNENCETLYGIPVEENIDQDPNYGEPEYLIPLIFQVEGSTEAPPAYPPDETDDGCNRIKHIGYAHVQSVQSELMPLNEFLDNNCVPDGVRFRIMEDVIPIFSPNDITNGVDPVVFENKECDQ